MIYVFVIITEEVICMDLVIASDSELGFLWYSNQSVQLKNEVGDFPNRVPLRPLVNASGFGLILLRQMNATLRDKSPRRVNISSRLSFESKWTFTTVEAMVDSLRTLVMLSRRKTLQNGSLPNNDKGVQAILLSLLFFQYLLYPLRSSRMERFCGSCTFSSPPPIK